MHLREAVFVLIGVSVAVEGTRQPAATSNAVTLRRRAPPGGLADDRYPPVELHRLVVGQQIGVLRQRHQLVRAVPASQSSPEFAELFVAIKQSERTRALAAEIDRLRRVLAEAEAEGKGEDELEPIRRRIWILSYAKEPDAFARAYAQWIAVRSGSAAMRGEIDLILSGRAGTVQQVWGHDDFLPVAAAFDRLFTSWGWTVTTLGVP